MKVKPPSRIYTDHYGKGHEEYHFRCPGCNYNHRVVVKWGARRNKAKPVWKFNNDFDNPTFTPDVVIRIEYGDNHVVCHFIIENGFFKYLDDCTHSLAGKTVEMLSIREIR